MEKLLKENIADEAVKAASKSLFSWLKEKFVRKSEHDKINAIETKPNDDATIKALEQMITDAQKDDEVLFASLQEQINQFSKIVYEKMPQIATEINSKIANSKNVIVDGFNNLNSQGNVFINVGDNNTK